MPTIILKHETWSNKKSTKTPKNSCKHTRFPVENPLGQATMCPYLWQVPKSIGFSRRYTRHLPSIASRNVKLLCLALCGDIIASIEITWLKLLWILLRKPFQFQDSLGRWAKEALLNSKKRGKYFKNSVLHNRPVGYLSPSDLLRLHVRHPRETRNHKLATSRGRLWSRRKNKAKQRSLEVQQFVY